MTVVLSHPKVAQESPAYEPVVSQASEHPGNAHVNRPVLLSDKVQHALFCAVVKAHSKHPHCGFWVNSTVRL